jgi:RNA ligase (TIGR02306 family)
MSEFHVNVVRLGQFNQHPNADTLDITKVFDYTVIAKRGNFKEGDLVVYVPIDSVVPDNEEWHWLAPLNSDGSERFPVGQVPEKYRLIEAKKIRGIFSQGCLSTLPPGEWKEGDDVREAMGITKYEPPVPMAMGGECEPPPKGWVFPVYTDIEGLRRYPNVIQEGEPVVVTEKIHGANARYCHDGERLWVGSHTQIKRRDPGVLWWNVALAEDLEDKLSHAPGYVFFGEVFGQVQDLKYNVKSGAKFRCFDVYDVKAQKYLDFDVAFARAMFCGIPWVPVLYRGPWKSDINELCEGKSTLADNVREGFVVRPVHERWHEEVGRVVLKRHGEGYLLRKKKV